MSAAAVSNSDAPAPNAAAAASAATPAAAPAPAAITITDPRIGPLGNEEFKIPLKIFNNGDPGEDIVISGIGGRYPDSGDVDEFWSKIMSGAELSTIDDRRWPVGEFIACSQYLIMAGCDIVTTF